MQNSDLDNRPKYVAIWQDPAAVQNPWLQEIFGDLIRESIVDGKREVVGDGVILFDYYVTSWRDSYYSRFRGRNAFLVDMSDEFYDFDPEIYANFRGVIRAYWSDVFRPETVRFLPLGYAGSLDIPEDAIRPSLDRQYVWSFLGQVNKSSRVEMAKDLASVEPHLLFATDDVPGLTMWNRGLNGQRRYSLGQNAAILRDSIFAPCPMGNVNLECYRIYEALENGTIPIMEKRFRFDYFHRLWGAHPVPSFSTWKDARRWMCEMLDCPAEVEALQRRCMEWWAGYKQQYRVSLGEFLAERSAAGSDISAKDIVLPKFRRPGWQMAELLKHHSVGAVRRRVARQWRRFSKERRFRVASTAKPS
jgi:hypothetical protein